MPATRKSHSKSRRGCQTCKKRHVKCDEQGPPCANCVVRKSSCSYASGEETKLPVASTPSEDTTATTETPETTLPTPQSHAQRLESSRRMDIELMHHWSTSTYKSFCSMTEEVYLMQVMVPRDGLQYKFLMDGILAAAALEKADALGEVPEAAEYIRAAAGYYDRALGSFRAQLSSITSENYIAVYIFSLVAITIVMAMPPPSVDENDQKKSVETAKMVFDMMHGSVLVALNSWDWMTKGPIMMKKALEQEMPIAKLDPGVRCAIARLHAMNDQMHAHDNSDASSPDHGSYKNAITRLEEFFAKEMEASIRFICVGWPGGTGKRFASALRSSDPFAFLLLMHWGILMNKYSVEIWWAKQMGSCLVKDLNDLLEGTALASSPEGKASISWVRSQVGLPG